MILGVLLIGIAAYYFGFWAVVIGFAVFGFLLME